MAVERPTLDALVERIIGDIDSTNPELYASVPKTPMNVFATAEAGLIHGLYGYADFLFRMSLPIEGGATGTFLDRWGALLGVTRKAATYAKPTIRFVATTSGTVPAGVTVRRADGFTYEIAAESAFDSGNNDLMFVATEVGSTGSIPDGSTVTLTESIVGMALTGEVQGDVEGTDEEGDQAYLVRIQDRLRSQPQGGSEADYLQWALSVSGVGYAWLVDTFPPFVDIRIVTDDEADLAPSSELLASVQAVIDEKKPVTAIPIVSAPTITERAVTLTSLTPNTASVHAAVTAALETFMALPAVRQPGSTIYRTAIDATIQNAAGVVTFTRTVPAADIVNGADEMSVLGVVTLPSL